MILARVAGRIVASSRSDSMENARYLLVRPCSASGGNESGGLVALDLIGAGPGEMVMVSQGSSARQTGETDGKPVDAVVVGIIDMVEENGKVVFR